VSVTPAIVSRPLNRGASALSERVLIIGANSAIAEATARIYAARGASFFLLARDRERVQSLAADLRIRGAASVDFEMLNVNDFAMHRRLLEQARRSLETIDVALIAHGTLSDQKACEVDFDVTLQELNTNAISVISCLTHLANMMKSQRSGTIAVISSVAGDRGRQSNYIYGTAKGALNVFTQGLRNRLYRSGVNVLTIKPGFVDTPMTKDFRKGLLWVAPDHVARDIVRAIERRKLVIYTPAFWRLIMAVIRTIPEGLFRRLEL
jgi:short-subunit dehydrogenase